MENDPWACEQQQFNPLLPQRTCLPTPHPPARPPHYECACVIPYQILRMCHEGTEQRRSWSEPLGRQGRSHKTVTPQGLPQSVQPASQSERRLRRPTNSGEAWWPLMEVPPLASSLNNSAGGKMADIQRWRREQEEGEGRRLPEPRRQMREWVESLCGTIKTKHGRNFN